MGKRWRALGILAVTLAAALLVKSEVLLFLLGLECLILPAAFFQVRWTAKRVRVQVVLPRPVVYQEESFQIRAELSNATALPVPLALLRLAVRVYPQQEELLLTGKVMLDGRETGSVCFSLDGSHCASLEIRPERLVVTDVLGIFSCRCAVDTGEAALLSILPKVVQEASWQTDAGTMFPGGEEGRERQSISGSETADIRSYREGDPLKNVHWKLTARMDALMVRQPAEPVQKRDWLFLNLQEPSQPPGIRRNPTQWDSFLATVVSVSAAGLGQGRHYRVFWMDVGQNRMVSYDVLDETGLQEMLCALLRTDTYFPGDNMPLLKEFCLDETKGTYTEINLQGNLVRAGSPG